MTLPRKGSRPIEVDGVAYRWKVTGNDGTIDLYVELADNPRAGLQARFEYSGSESRDLPGGPTAGPQSRSVTPTVVQKVIEWALSNGWVPGKQGGRPFVVSADQTTLIVPVKQ